jgi:hypothetical protein
MFRPHTTLISSKAGAQEDRILLIIVFAYAREACEV